MGCIDDIIDSFIKCGSELIPEEHVAIGCGLDRGPIVRGVRGDENRMEFDVWGDRVNTAAKLEAFCKKLTVGSDSRGVLVISPFAADYINDCTMYTKVDLPPDVNKSVHGISWVLKKEYKKNVFMKKVA